MARSSSDSPPQKPYSRCSRAPGLAGLEDGADRSESGGRPDPAGPGLGTLAGGGEEQVGLPVAGCDRLPGDRGVDIPDIDDDFEASGTDTEAFREDADPRRGQVNPRRQKSTQCVSPVRRSATEIWRGILAGSSEALPGRAVRPGLDGLALAAGVPGDAADRHVDPEPGGGALLLGFAAPGSALPGCSRAQAAARSQRPGRRDRSSGPWPHGPRGLPRSPPGAKKTAVCRVR